MLTIESIVALIHCEKKHTLFRVIKCKILLTGEDSILVGTALIPHPAQVRCNVLLSDLPHRDEQEL